MHKLCKKRISLITESAYYASVVYVYLASLGVKIAAEDVTNRGRIDLTLFVEDKIYIIEFQGRRRWCFAANQRKALIMKNIKIQAKKFIWLEIQLLDETERKY